MSLPPCPVMFCGDALEKGYSLTVSRCTTEEVLELTRYFERWMFKRVEPEFEERARRRQNPWEPIQLPDTAFMRWAEAVGPRVKPQDSMRLR